MPPLADIIQNVIHRDACPLDFRATTAIDDLSTHWVPRLSCLMQQRDHNTSGGPQAVRDTAPDLDVLCLGCLEEKEARYPCPDGCARDENIPRIALVHGGATLPQTESSA